MAVLLVALLAAGFAIAFRASLAWALRAAFGAPDVVAAMTTAPVWVRIVLPCVGGLVAGLIGRTIAGSATGQGVGDVMEAVVLGRVRLQVGVTLKKCAASWAAIVTGGSLGREGPLIQFGGAAGKLVSDRLGLSTRRARLLVAAGTAAGFAAAYNTPFAAVLFVVEVVTGVVFLDAIVPALVATAIATLLTRAVAGAGPIYGQQTFQLQAPSELLAFAGLGVGGALAAQGFMRALSWGELAFRRSWLGLPWRPALGGLLAGGVVAWLPAVAGNGYEPLHALLAGAVPTLLVAELLLGKCAATVASVSSGSPGGVFTPTLLVGGTVGILFRDVAGLTGVSLGPAGGYALVGMAAATAATTHAPLLAAVMAFELSGDYAIVLPLVLSTAVATLVSRSLRRDSIYAAELRGRGVAWEVTMDGRRVVERTK
ncbi:MAG TPA: chloride channel protein [Polyangiaceae bacterium]|nr:chloride channel protein [Polyangiaceae bacterium]